MTALSFVLAFVGFALLVSSAVEAVVLTRLSSGAIARTTSAVLDGS